MKSKKTVKKSNNKGSKNASEFTDNIYYTVKKSNNKISKPVKPTNDIVSFNRANALAFADSIYSSNKDEVRFIKLCDKTLSNGKSGDKTLHCAVGKAYLTFVNDNIKKVQNHNMLSYEGIYSNTGGSTGAAIDDLAAKAQLKTSEKNLLKSRCELARLLEEVIDLNDCGDGSEPEILVYRAYIVSNFFRKRIAPLLK